MRIGILEKLRIKRVASQPDDFQKIRTAFLKEANEIVEGCDLQGNPLLKVNIGSHLLTFHFNVNNEGEAKFSGLTVEKHALKINWEEVKKK